MTLDWPTPDSDTLAGLVAGMRDDPDNDLRKLIVADWYEEAGHADRARTIRARVDMMEKFVPANREHMNGAGAIVLVDHRHSDRLVRLAPPLPGVTLWTHKGFVIRWHGPLEAWRAHGRELCRREPVRTVSFEGAEPWRHQRNRVMSAFWFDNDYYGKPASVIPDWLWQSLAVESGENDGTSRMEYITEKDAFDALSAAVIRWACEEKIR